MDLAAPLALPGTTTRWRVYGTGQHEDSTAVPSEEAPAKNDPAPGPILWEGWIHDSGDDPEVFEAPTARDAALAMSRFLVRHATIERDDPTDPVPIRIGGAVERLEYVRDDAADPVGYWNAEGWLASIQVRLLEEPGAWCEWSVRVHEHTVQRAAGEDASVDWDRVPHETDLTLYTSRTTRRVLIDNVRSVAIVDDRTVLDRAWPAHWLWGRRMHGGALRRARCWGLQASVEHLTGEPAEIRDQLLARGWECFTMETGMGLHRL